MLKALNRGVSLLLFAITASVGAPSVAQEATGSLTPYQLVQSQYDANARGDIDGMMAVLAPDVVWIEMAGFPYGGTYRRTGKAMSARVVHVWCIEGGKVVRFEQFADTLLISQAMVGARRAGD